MRIGITGLGNVGAATLRLLQQNAVLLTRRGGQTLDVVAVSARDKGKARTVSLTGIEWVDDACILAACADIDVVVEAIGGAEGIAYEVVETALAHGKHVVTANKALIAAHGRDLALAAEKKDLQLSFEAAVCGGVPVLKMLREGLAANHITSVRGILNGTCNYILTRMEQNGIAFADALAEAQHKGYAEADPAGDIDGLDTANKLAILSAVAFGTTPNLESVFVEGIRALTQKDIKDAAARGGRIKLLGIASKTPQGEDMGEIIQRVQPVFVPHDAALAGVNGVLNGVEITGDFAGALFIQGAGAGGNVTASAIVADLIDIARGYRGYAFGAKAATL